MFFCCRSLKKKQPWTGFRSLQTVIQRVHNNFLCVFSGFVCVKLKLKKPKTHIFSHYQYAIHKQPSKFSEHCFETKRWDSQAKNSIILCTKIFRFSPRRHYLSSKIQSLGRQPCLFSTSSF